MLAVFRSAQRIAPRTRRAFSTGVKVSVNGRDLEVPNGSTVLQACELGGAVVPRFCYHDRLSIAGNCRMCLVEVEKSPKPVASCAMPVMPGMKIKTETDLVHKAREGVMEFLLANHPLDCPICDQGGECDLQDQSMEYGSDRGRYRELKRTVEDKNIGPLVKTVMTRCIHCTRCVRYTTEVCGTETLGTTGRGNQMEIGTYTEQTLDSELSGNVIDLCPVGALTSKPFAFTARPWELDFTESVDVLDAVGASIRIDTRGMDVMRILPRLNEAVNEEWISDKSRFSYDGLKRQRLDAPYVRKIVNGQSTLEQATWKEALVTIAGKVRQAKPSELLAVAGDLADAESMIVLKDLFNKLGSTNTVHAQEFSTLPLAADVRSGYLANSGIQAIEDADVLVLVGSNPRMEAALISGRMRKAVNRGLKVYSVGPQAELRFNHTHLGNDIKILNEAANGKGSLANVLGKAKKPMVWVGLGALSRQEGGSVLGLVDELKKKVPALTANNWNGVNILHTAASRVGALDIGFVRGPDDVQPAKVVYLLNADSQQLIDSIPKDAFVVYQGSHGDIGASRADVILPSAAYTEKTATYVNLEGRVQRTHNATPLVGQSKEDWEIVRAVSEVCGVPLKYDNASQVRERLVEVAPHFASLGDVEPSSFKQTVAHPVNAQSGALRPFFDNFFMTDPISRSSKTMAKCTTQMPSSRNSYC